MTQSQALVRRTDHLFDRPLPSSEDAERCVLGAVILDDRFFIAIAEHLTPADFYSPLNRRIFAAMMALFDARKRIDPVGIVEEMKREGPIEPQVGLVTITNMTYGLPMWSLADSGQVIDYCSRIRAKARVRELIHTCSQITASALSDGETDEILQLAQTRINDVCTVTDKRGFASLSSISNAEVSRITDLRNGIVPDGGLKSGLHALDHLTGGFQKSDLIIIAGRPGMGKSALAGQIALNISSENPGAVVAIFSLEMSKEQYTRRLLSTCSSVDFQRMRRGALNDDEMARVQRASTAFGQIAFEIDDSSSISALEMRSKLLKVRAEKGRLDAVIVDYLQRMITAKKTESRQQEVSRIAQDLKTLAKDFDVPVIALASLNRECEKRNPPRPKMSDLRDSGDIESEADLVAFLYRPHHYDSTANPRLCEFIVDKHRNGPTDTIHIGFLGEFTRFGNYDLSFAT